MQARVSDAHPHFTTPAPHPVCRAAVFDAPPDELRGKDPHARIRKAAKEALEAIFDTTPATREWAVAGCGRCAAHRMCALEGTLTINTSLCAHVTLHPTAVASLGAGGHVPAPMSGVLPTAASRGKYGGLSGGGVDDGGVPSGSPSSVSAGGSSHAFPPVAPAGSGSRRSLHPVDGGSGGGADMYVSMDDGDGTPGAATGPAYDENASIAVSNTDRGRRMY